MGDDAKILCTIRLSLDQLIDNFLCLLQSRRNKRQHLFAASPEPGFSLFGFETVTGKP